MYPYLIEVYDAGINWIDTAAVYGLGHSEEVVGRALQGRSRKPFVFTKCERVWYGTNRREITKSLKADSIRREVEASLGRLQLDVIDLYQIHWHGPDEDIEEGCAAMADLQREGKVRWIGVSNFSAEQRRRAQAIAPITSLAAALFDPLARNRGVHSALRAGRISWANKSRQCHGPARRAEWTPRFRARGPNRAAVAK